ncbi:MAG TPA: signal peptide peptidase SppA, partial [Bacteroidales bacterium]|nr:signal peptide peptidase SppA [Bacteroidales bacterium]
MKQFFKFMFASVLGCMISGVILFLIAIGIVASLAALTDPPTVVKPNSVLIINLDGPITERTSKDPFATGGFGGFQTNPGLNDILNNIQKAATDPNIKGILLESTIVPASFTTLSEIRRELARFRESGKFLIAYGDYYPQNTYYLASVAERVYVHPEGDVSLRGLHLQMVFLKGLLEKLDIETQVIRYGKYKSAAEPLTREDLSMENRLQITEYANTLWNGIKTDIADSRGITAEEVNRLAEGFLIVDPKKALEYKLVDGLKYRDEVLTDLRQRLGIAQDAEINKIELAKYTKAPVIRDNPRLSRNKVAVIYAQGNIVTGEGDEQIIGSDCISKAIREAREDKDVKAIVLRINSGGGSALASDVILREVMLARQEKPIVASMGAMAASGGYYIASRATKIIANPSTLTGSIGVIGLIPNMENFFNNKLGIAFDDVKTNTYA